MKSDIIFVTGIDTDIGKTYITGLLAKYLFEKGFETTTFKVIQTGNEKISEDIKTHREIMGISLSKEDKDGLTCPQIFKYPASPHLAAQLEGKKVSIEKIDNALKQVGNIYEKIVLEGVGGIFVPIVDTYTLLDFAVERKFETVVVTTPKLGSINHTLMTLYVLNSKGIKIKGIVYNLCIDEKEEIKNDFKNVLNRFYPEIPIVEVPKFNVKNPPNIDFSSFNL